MKRLIPLLISALLMPCAAWAGAMEDSLQSFFARGVEFHGAKAELVEVVRWPDATGPLRWSLPNLSRPMNRVSLLAEEGEGANVRRWYVPVRVHWWANVVVAGRDLDARSKLASYMLTIARKDVAGLGKVWWSNVTALNGMRMVRSLRKGDVVSGTDVRRPPLLRAGDRVNMMVKSGSLTVYAEGKALRAAKRGDRVLIENIRSHEKVQAEVVDAHTVIVYAGGA